MQPHQKENKDFEPKVVESERKKVDGNSSRRKVQVFCQGPSRTKQEFAEDSNINNIIAKAVRTGVSQELFRPPVFEGEVAVGEFGASSYQDALNKIAHANQAFARLPSKTRERFGNEPAKFLEFMENPEENHLEMEKLGLAKLIKRPVEKQDNAVPENEQRVKKDSSKSENAPPGKAGDKP